MLYKVLGIQRGWKHGPVFALRDLKLQLHTSRTPGLNNEAPACGCEPIRALQRQTCGGSRLRSHSLPPVPRSHGPSAPACLHPPLMPRPCSRRPLLTSSCSPSQAPLSGRLRFEVLSSSRSAFILFLPTRSSTYASRTGVGEMSIRLLLSFHVIGTARAITDSCVFLLPLLPYMGRAQYIC